MADHGHLILILAGCVLGLGEVVRRFKAKTSKKAGRRLWQPNYYEHVIRSEEVLHRIRKYVQNNPLAEKIEFEEFYKNDCR
jgi:REP element-mobilizing transposase RayT